MTASIFEAIMMITFGASWPFAILKTLRSKSAAGKSLLFMTLILTGYLAGMLFKIFGTFDAVFFFYVLNFLLVLTDFILTIRLRRKGA